MAGLPVNVSTCTVTGRLAATMQVAESDPEPDVVPLVGKVIFTPSVPTVIHEASNTIFVPNKIEVTLDDSGNFNVILVASDDPDLNPTNWTYTVSFALASGSIAPFSFVALSGQTIEITDITPVTSSAGSPIVRGETGPPGPPNVLTVGDVTTAPAGSDADAEVTGTPPAQELHLTIPRGEVGPQGAKGDTGNTGPANTLTKGTATTGAAGTSMDFTITGTAPNQTLNLTIPKGDPGGWVASASQAAPDLNTMTTPGLYYVTGAHTNSAAAGDSHVEVVAQSATVVTQMQTVAASGRIFRRTCNSGTWTGWLELVTKGTIGSGDLTGTGSPEGVLTAPVGTYYTDTVGTVGAWRWQKKTGAGNTGWKVIHGDTGLRGVTALLKNGWTGQAYLRRVNDMVDIRLDSLNASAASSGIPLTLPSGFSLTSGLVHRSIFYTTAMTLRRASTVNDVTIVGYAAGDVLSSTLAGITGDAWPTTLPGFAA